MADTSSRTSPQQASQPRQAVQATKSPIETIKEALDTISKTSLQLESGNNLANFLYKLSEAIVAFDVLFLDDLARKQQEAVDSEKAHD